MKRSLYRKWSGMTQFLSRKSQFYSGSDYIRERRKKIESMIEMWIHVGDRSWDDLLPLSFNIESMQFCLCPNWVGQVARIERFGTSLEKSESARSYYYRFKRRVPMKSQAVWGGRKCWIVWLSWIVNIKSAKFCEVKLWSGGNPASAQKRV